MTKRIINYFDRFSLFSKSQFGFLSGKSTVDALIDLTENIFNSLDNREHHISILIDLKRAFDTVNHKLLLGKLERYGIRDLPLQWLKSYLSNRESYVGMGPASSRKVVSNIGVPQGSTIGPVLFLIYINDLPACCPRLSTTLFADDTTISYSHKNSNDLISIVNYELNLVKEWINANRLTLNVGKTECILFSNRNLEPIHNHVTLDNTSLSFSSKCKFLGVILDTKLNFSNHIDQVLGRLTNSARILYSIKNYLPLKSRLNFYFAFVFSQLSYNIIIWGSAANVHLKPLITQHKRIIRLITDSGPMEHTSPLFHRLNILKLEDLYKFHLSIYMFKSVARGEYSVQHSLNTRSRYLAAPTFHRLTLTQRAVSYAGPSMWNKIPLSIRNCSSLSIFKRNLKSWFIDDYLN